MSGEPERPIEKLLRACAKERREQGKGAPFELHPATRRLLQGEVARRYVRRQAGQAGTGWRLLLRPRLVWAAGVLIVVGVLAAAIVPHLGRSRRESTLALNRPAAETPKAPVPAAPSIDVQEPQPEGPRPGNVPVPAPPKALTEPPPPPSTLALADAVAQAAEEEKLMRNRNTAAQGRASAPEPASGAVAGIAPALARNEPSAESVARTASAAQNGVAAPVPAQRSVPIAGGAAAPNLSFNPAAKDADADSKLKEQSFDSLAKAAAPAAAGQAFYARKSEAVVGLSFVRLPRRADRASYGLTTGGIASTAVLSAFRFEQNGTNVTLSDNDGSVYTGTIQQRLFAGSAQASSLTARPATSVARRTLAQPVPTPLEGYAFRVSGTSRTLNQPVVFTGEFISGTNAVPGSNIVAVGAAFGTPVQAPVKARVTGKLSIGGGEQVPIDAEQK